MTARELFMRAQTIHYACSTEPGATVEVDGAQVKKSDAMTEVIRMYDMILGVMLKNEGSHNETWRPLYGLGTAYQERGLNNIASVMLEMSAHHRPDFGGTWNNLGIAYRGAGREDKALVAFKAATELMPGDVNPPSNISGMLINTGNPNGVLEWAEKALAIDPDHAQSRWHRAMGLLELQRWDEAWEWHEARLNPTSNCKMARRNYHGDRETPMWDGKTKGRVVIHGEQGLGDEIMFASCLPDAIATGAEIVLECAPRNANLLASSFPGVKVLGTHATDGMEWTPELGKPDFKTALGSLPKFYRRSEADFPKVPYLKPSAEKRQYWRGELKPLGRWPKVGVAWQGGHFNTRVDLRSFRLEEFAPLLRQKANFVSLQYTKSAKAEVEASGFRIAHWPKAAEAEDMEELAALIAELDLVISVCQTAIHIAGAVGTPTWVLTPAAPAWRYGATDRTDMAWYGPHLRQIRQKGEGWGVVVETAALDLAGFLASRRKKAA